MDRAPHDASVNDSSQVACGSGQGDPNCGVLLGFPPDGFTWSMLQGVQCGYGLAQSTRISALSCRVPHPDGRFRAPLREHAVHEGYSKEAIDAVSRFPR